MSSSARRAPVVAIDGPAGAGKSTVSRRVAEELEYLLLDTGALYRCVALAALEAGALADDAVALIAERMVAEDAVRFAPSEDGQVVLLRGKDVSAAIRSQEVTMLASQVSAIPGVRKALLQMQRAVGAKGRVVVEGRDIGTVVFPDAEAKFFLTASVGARARRRYEEVREDQPDVSLQRIEEDVRERDRRDSQRPVAPLTQASDAELVDSTELSIDGVVARIVERVRELERQLVASAEQG